MASIGIMTGGAVLNAVAFHARYLETIPAPCEKKKSGTTRLSRLTRRFMPNIKKTEPTNDRMKDQAKQNFTDTDYALQTLQTGSIALKQYLEDQKMLPTSM